MRRHVNKIDWRHFHIMCERLGNKISHAKFQSIYGHPRGGIITATIISHYLNIPLVTKIEKEMGVYDVIIIDDIANTGKTLKGIDYFRQTATLFVNETRCKYYPDFFVEKTKDWIVFPYGYEEDVVSKATIERYEHIH
jgi:hypoxanthine phosphoribosyltransferase